MRLLSWLRRKDPITALELRARALEEHLAQLPETERADLIAAAEEQQAALSSLGIVNAYSCRRSGAFPTAAEVREDTESILASARRCTTD